MSRISPGERAAEQRALLDAAALVFDRRGFVGASVKDLADETSTTVRAIKRHFGSKEGVARAVVDEQNRRMVAALDTALLRHGPLEALIHASRAMADLLTSDPTVRAGVRLTMELAACDPAVAGQFRGWVDQVAGLFERAKEAGDVVDRLDPTELGATFVAYFTGVHTLAAVLGEHDELPARLVVMWRTVIDGAAPLGRRLGLHAVTRDAFGGWEEFLGAA